MVDHHCWLLAVQAGIKQALEENELEDDYTQVSAALKCFNKPCVNSAKITAGVSMAQQKKPAAAASLTSCAGLD